MPIEKDSITRDLLPPVPEELSIEPPKLRTIGDLNLYPFFKVKSTTDVRLSPDVVNLFPQLSRMIEFVAIAVRNVLKKQHEVAAQPDEAAEAELKNYVDQLVRTLNERIPVAVGSVFLKGKYADRPNLLALLENKESPNDEKLRLITRRAIDKVVKMKIVESRRKFAEACNVNPGQLSNFVRMNGALGMDKVVECLEYAAAKAQEAGSLDELKRFIEEE